MANIIAWNADKASHADPVIDAVIYKRGDVVDIMPDDWQPRPFDLADPRLSVVSVPGVDPAQLAAFLSGDEGDPVNELLRQRRAFSFDMDKWEKAGRGAINSIAAALAHKKAKGPRRHPAVIGKPSGIIG